MAAQMVAMLCDINYKSLLDTDEPCCWQVDHEKLNAYSSTISISSLVMWLHYSVAAGASCSTKARLQL